MRRVVSVFDTVDQEPDFVPARGKPPIPPQLTPEEERKRAGKPEFDPEPEDEQGYEEMSL
jgi:hypothetical protein